MQKQLRGHKSYSFKIEAPLILPRWVAAILKDVYKTLILNQMYFYIESSKKIKEGKRWYYASSTKLHNRDFPFMCEKTIQRKLKELVELGYLITEDYNKLPYDRTKWYAINYKKLDELDDAAYNLHQEYTEKPDE